MEQTKIQDAVTVTDDYAVVVADKEGLLEFFKNGNILENLYTGIEKKALGLVADVSTKEGRSQIKSAARQLASVKTKVDDLGKKVVANLKELPKVIDANRKTFREKMEALQDEIRRPVTEIEERQKRLESIASTHVNLAMADSATLDAEIKKLEAMPLTDEEWKESMNDAIMTVGGEINALKLLREAALKKEEDARRLAELEAKQAEAERRAAEAEKARQEAEEKARNAKDAIERASIGAQQAVTPLPKTLPQPKPSKWTPEMKAVNKAILDTFTDTIEKEVQKVIVGFTPSGYRVAAENTAKALVKAIVNGTIEHLKVEY